MTNEVKKVPELRFPEFGGEWEEKSIGDLGSFYYGKSAPKWSITKDATIPCVRYGELYTKHKGIVKEIYSYTNIDSNNLRFSEGGEILVPRVGEDPMDFAKCSYLPFSGIAIGEMISVYNTSQNPIFITTYFNSQMKYEFAKRVEGASVSNLYYSYLTNINMKIPTINEQQKIGEFFSKLDRQIELEEQKLAKLEEQKKGYMQQIFSRQFLFENEKGDTDYSWRNFKIKDIFSKIESGNRLPKTNLVEGNIPYVIAQTTNNGVFMHISEDTLDYHKNKLKLFKKGSITISIDNPEAMFIQEMDFFTSNVMRVIHNENLKRGSHIFIMESLKKLTQSYNWSVKFSGPIIMDSTVKFPVYNDNKVNWNVVNKIGDFFNTFEIRINRQSDKIKLLEERKKGFLQKMFI